MKKSFVKYMIALLLFGSNGIVASNINLKSYEIVFLRTGIGSILLIALFLLKMRKAKIIKNRRDMMFTTLSGIAMGISWICLYEAYAQIGVGISSLLYYCGPVIVMVLSPVLFKERLTFHKIIGFAFIMIGVLFINKTMSGGDIGLYGVICGIISAVMYAFMVTFNKYIKKINGLENSMLQLFVSFLTVAVFTAVKNGEVVHISSGDAVWILILGLVNTGLGCYFYFSSIGNLTVQTVVVCGYLEPLSAVGFSVIILKERMLPIQLAGVFLIIFGAVICELKLYKSIKN